MPDLSITSLSLSEFKGQSRQVEVQRLNLLVGPNGSGKTAIALAPAYAVQGYTSLGARDEATALLAGPGGCGVRVQLSDGFGWSRQLRRDVEGALSSKLLIAGQEKLTLRRAQGQLMEKVGDFAPMWDLSVFTGQSPDKQRDYVLDLCARATGLEGYNQEKMIEEIIHHVLSKHPDVGPAGADRHKQVHCAFARFLPERWQRPYTFLLRAVAAEIKGEASEAIGAALQEAKDQQSSAKTSHTNALAARSGIQVRIAELGESEDGGVLETRIVQLNAKRDGLVAQAGELEGQQKALAKAKREANRLAVSYAEAGNRVEDLKPEPEEENQATEEFCAGLEAEAEEMSTDTARVEELRSRKGAFGEGISAAKAEWEQAGDYYTKALSAQRNCTDAEVVAEQKMGATAKALERAKANPWQKAQELLFGFTKVLEQPYPTEAFTLRDFITEQIGKDIPEVIEARLQQEQAEVDALAKASEVARELCDKATKSHVAATTAYRASEDKHAIVCEEIQEAQEAQHAKNTEALSKREEAKAIRDSIEEREKAEHELDSAGVAMEVAEHERDRLAAECDEDAAFDLEANLANVERDLEGFRSSLKDVDMIAGVRAELEACDKTAQGASDTYEASKLVISAIKAVREKVVQELTKPLIDQIAAFLSRGGMGQWTPYVDLEAAKGKKSARFELGWINPLKKKVALRAMSGGETAIYSAALSYALLCLADPPLKVLCVEADRADPESLDRLLSMIEACEDLSNAFVATWRAGGREPWNMIDCGA